MSEKKNVETENILEEDIEVVEDEQEEAGGLLKNAKAFVKKHAKKIAVGVGLIVVAGVGAYVMSKRDDNVPELPFKEDYDYDIEDEQEHSEEKTEEAE